jgi:hypothetical protein
MVSISLKSPSFVTVFLAVVTGVILLVFLFAYIYLLVNDRDALRSEKFTLSKLAIERSVVGDSAVGFLDPSSGGRPERPIPIPPGTLEHE